MGALYSFCFAPAQGVAALELADCGWEDPIRIDVAGGVAAVVAEVPRERFEGPEAETRLADLPWLLPRVEAHDRVIARVMERASVFPLRFGTLFSSREALTLETLRRRRALTAFFAAMAGREEWAVKAVLMREQAIEARRLALFPQGPDDGVSAGRSYLLRQRQRAEAERALGPWLSGVVAELDRQLRGLCASVVVRPAAEPAVANWASLAERGHGAELVAALDRLAPDYEALGIELHCSGPWPLYSFCAIP